MFYAIRTDTYAHGRTFTHAYGFANKRTRDMVCDAIDGIVPTSARSAYHVRDEERREFRDGRPSRHCYCDMRMGEYWEDEFAPLFGNAVRLGNFDIR
jgi:hypothetical protein